MNPRTRKARANAPELDEVYKKIRAVPEREDQRRPGPPPALNVRRFGEPVLADALAVAIGAQDRVERATHGFHTYPANMHPDGAKALIEVCPGPVYDPFCGGGTVLVEALLAGRAAAGSDLSPIAVLVARARTAGPEIATPLRAAARRVSEKAKDRRESPVVTPELAATWYEPHVASELAHLRDAITEEADTIRPLLWAVLSSILIKVSFRESDTRNVRTTSHRHPGTTNTLFHKKARELGRALETLPAGRHAEVRRADAGRKPPPPGTGLILTSPPYPGVYDYLPMQQLRYAWLDLDPGAGLVEEVGSRRSFRALGRTEGMNRWRNDTAAWVNNQASGLQSGARMAIVVGDGFVGGRLVDALFPTVEAMEQSGMKILARASADRLDHAREVIRIEHLVLAEKR